MVLESSEAGSSRTFCQGQVPPPPARHRPVWARGHSLALQGPSTATSINFFFLKETRDAAGLCLMKGEVNPMLSKKLN